MNIDGALIARLNFGSLHKKVYEGPSKWATKQDGAYGIFLFL